MPVFFRPLRSPRTSASSSDSAVSYFTPLVLSGLSMSAQSLNLSTESPAISRTHSPAPLPIPLCYDGALTGSEGGIERDVSMAEEQPEGGALTVANPDDPPRFPTPHPSLDPSVLRPRIAPVIPGFPISVRSISPRSTIATIQAFPEINSDALIAMVFSLCRTIQDRERDQDLEDAETSLQLEELRARIVCYKGENDHIPKGYQKN